MAERGFDLLDPPPAATPPPAVEGFDYDMGITSEERAAQSGYQYRFGDFGSIDPAVARNAPMPEGWTEAYEEAWKGDDGCRYRPDDELGQGAPEPSAEVVDMADRIDQESVMAAWGEPVVEPALTVWRTCMERNGYPYATPQEAYEAFDGFASTAQARRPGDATASPAEIATAVRDMACKTESGLVALWRQELGRIRWAMVQDNLPSLLVLQEVTAQRVANAQALIERYG
jgi:hypothetical protein